MRRIVSIVAVLAVAALVASAQPVAAADAGLEIASENTTDADFQSATELTRLQINGSGESAEVVAAGAGVVVATDSGGLKVVSNDSVDDLGVSDAVLAGGAADFDGDGETEVAFADGNGNIKTVSRDGGSVSDVGVDTDTLKSLLGGAGDVDSDGDPEIVYADGSGDLTHVEGDGSDQVAIGPTNTRNIGLPTDIDADGTLEIPYRQSQTLKWAEADGTTTDSGVGAFDVGGGGDLDGDGETEIAVRRTNEDLDIVDDAFATTNIVPTPVENAGAIADLDGDGDAEIASEDESTGEAMIVDADGSTALTGIDANDLGGAVGSGDQATYVGQAHSVDQATDIFADVDPDGGTATVIAQADPDGDGSWTDVASTTVTTATNVTLDVSAVGGTAYRVRAELPNTVSSQGSLSAEGVLFQASAPVGSGASPTGTTTTYDGDISLQVNDSDVALAQGDTVTVEATSASGGTIGSTTITTNQTVSFAYSAKAGPNNITWTLTDSYGDSATVNQEFTTPAEIRVENASAPGTLITGSSNTITVSFFDESDTVFRRTTTDGTVNLSGLPAAPEQGYQVNVEDGTDFNSRQVVVDSLFEQQTVFLLPAGADTATVEFILDDKTGQFDPETTTLILERPINASGNTTFKSVFASEVGAGGSQRVVLENGQRYRIRVRNTQGRERALGSFDVSGSDVVTLDIGQLSFAVADSPQTFNVSADTTVSNGTVDSAQFKFRDPTDQTSEVRVDFVGANNTTLASASSSTQPVTQFAFTQQFSQNVTASDLRIAYEIDRSGETTSGVLRAGASQFSPGIPLKPGLKQLFAVGLIIMVGGLFSQTNAAAGAVVTPLFAAGLWFIDWLPPGVTILGIALALGVGVLVNIKTRP